MSWNISRWSIKNPVTTVVMFVTLTGIGIACFFGLGIEEQPDVDIPAVSVTVTQRGASPSELENQVTRRVEDAVAGIRNVKHISSKISDGTSRTSIEFYLGTDIARAVNDVRNAVSSVRSHLPQTIDEPIVQELTVLGGPFATFALSSDRLSILELSRLVDHDITRSLMSIPGVGRISRVGGVEREVHIDLDPARLQAMEISAEMVNSQVRALNLNSPGGRGQLGSGEQSIRTIGSASTIEDLGATAIGLPSGRYALLNTLGSIRDDAAEQRQLALLNGRPVVAFSVSRSTGSNLVQVEDAVDECLRQLNSARGCQFRIEKLKSSASFVRKSYELSWESLIVGGAAAMTVIWIVLKDLRGAGIAAAALPLSIIPTFSIIKCAGFTLNNMTLLALALVTGILVDDAIVEIENIARHASTGKKAYQAALDGADEIGLAVVATTMTLVMVFMPVAFMGGLPGEFFKPFGLTVATAVLASLIVARMMTPLMCAFWLRPIAHARTPLLMIKAYKRTLCWSLRHRVTVMLAALILFGGSLLIFGLVPTSLISQQDREECLINVELQPGTTIDETRGVCEELTHMLLAHTEIKTVLATVGATGRDQLGTAGSQGNINCAEIQVILKPRGQRSASQATIERCLRSELSSIPGARISFARLDSITPGKPIEVVLAGDDPAALGSAARALMLQMRSSPCFVDVSSSDVPLRPEILIRPDFDRAAREGVTVETIARTALIATVGDIDANLARFNLPDRQINVRVQLDPRSRHDLQTIMGLRVAGAAGHLLPLGSVASVEFGYGNSQIDRYDRARQVKVECNLGSGKSLGQAVRAVKELPAMRSIPEGVRFHFSGDAEKQQEVFSAFFYAVIIGIPLVYAVLVLLFGEFLYPLAIMMSLPLCLCGTLFSLTVSNKDIGLYALIGMILLVGLVTKNATLLMEYALSRTREGTPLVRALLAAGAVRMRPILMTTAAMIVGMIPIACASGAGAEVRSPMAIAVIGGLTTSSVLSLIVVPVLCTFVDDASKWLSGKFSEILSAEDKDHSPWEGLQQDA